MKDQNYITIQGWMVNRLDLKPVDLIVYATIYGFSQDGSSKFNGSTQYLMDLSKSSRNTVKSALRRLEDRGLIQRNTFKFKGTDYNEFWANEPEFEDDEEMSVCEGCQEASHLCECKIDRGGQKMTGGYQNLTGGVSKIDPNTIDNKNSIKYSLKSNKKMKSVSLENFTDSDKEIWMTAESFRLRIIDNLKKTGAPTKKIEEAQIRTTCDPIRLMFQQDGVSREQMKQVWTYLDYNNPESEFWRGIILNTDKLRKHFQKLIMKYNERKESTSIDKTRAVLNRTDGFAGYE